MSLFESGFNLPPGVSPNDWHIVGKEPVPCENCQHLDEDHDMPEKGENGPCLVEGCNCIEYVEAEEPEPDYDAMYEKQQEARTDYLEGRDEW